VIVENYAALTATELKKLSGHFTAEQDRMSGARPIEVYSGWRPC